MVARGRAWALPAGVAGSWRGVGLEAAWLCWMWLTRVCTVEGAVEMAEIDLSSLACLSGSRAAWEWERVGVEGVEWRRGGMP